MEGKLYIITGASGSGKTTLLNSLVNNKDINVLKAPKYADREIRDNYDDIIYCKVINKENFDIVYKLNQKTYGIKLNEIVELLNKGNNLFIILSDIRVIKRLKSILKKSIITLYISSAINPDKIAKIQEERYLKDFKLDDTIRLKLYKQFSSLKSATDLGLPKELFLLMRELLDNWKNYLPESKSTEIRKSKIRDFHKTYVDNIELFDHVILNYKEPNDMMLQVVNLLDFYKSNSKIKKKQPVVFIVSAASGSGKGELMQAVRDVIGINKVHITSKQAKRDKKPNDKRDGMLAIGKNGKFDGNYNIRWTFHKGELHEGTEYAVSKNEILNTIKKGIPQIFISNIQQIDNFSSLLNNNAVFIYLHATRSTKEIEDFQYANNKEPGQAEQKIKEINKVYQDYINNIFKFDHVLLNTAYLEDLYEQIFKLIDYYNTI